MENSVFSVLENRYFKNKNEDETIMMMEGFRLSEHLNDEYELPVALQPPSAHPHHHLWLLTVSVC